MSKQKLRIGLLINDYSIPAWQYKLIGQLVASHHSEIVLVVRNDTKVEQGPSAFNNLVFDFYRKFEDKFFKTIPNAFEKKNLKELISCKEIALSPIESKNIDQIKEADIKKIQTHEIDVFLKFGFKVFDGDILKCAKCGIWSYHHGNNKTNRGGPAGVWEVIEESEDTGSTLRLLNEDIEGGLVLYESYSHTDHVSFKRNKNNFYWKSSSFIGRKLDELYRIGQEQFFLKYNVHNAKPSFYYNKLYVTPTNWEMLRGLMRVYYKSILTHIRRFFYFDQWILLIKFTKTDKLAQSFYEFKRLTPPKDRFWADPFILQRDSKYFIFLEELVYKEKRGKISVMEIDENGSHSTPKVILETNYHLSYPFLIEDHGELYMMPETKGNKTIEIYKCTSFPYEWTLEKIMFHDIMAVDSTIFKFENKYWLFTNIKENEGASAYDELFLFFSDSLLGNWKPHPLNPIVSDVKYARPAGNIFIYNDKIFRPSQNCSKHYGYGMQIREILTLTETDYEERQVQSIYPNWSKDLVSTHTLNNSGKLTIIDALVRRRNYF